MALIIERNDLIKVKADAIVNTANPFPEIGTGVESAIYKACGVEDLLAARRKIGVIRKGSAKSTPSFLLGSNGVKYIIHAVGCLYEGGNKGEEVILHKTYKAALEEAYKLKCKSVAIPLLGSGNYNFPKALSLEIALSEINSFIIEHNIEVILVIYDKESVEISQKIFGEFKKYIDENYVNENQKINYNVNRYTCLGFNKKSINKYPNSIISGSRALHIGSTCGALFDNVTSSKNVLKDFEDFRDENYSNPLNFSDTLRHFMKIKGDIPSPDIYKKIGLDRKYFNKIYNGTIKTPGKVTILAIGLVLHLTMEEFEEFLASAGYNFMPSNQFDVAIKFCVIKGIYDINEVNILLAELNLNLIGVEE